jgi:hypothetical protein
MGIRVATLRACAMASALVAFACGGSASSSPTGPSAPPAGTPAPNAGPFAFRASPVAVEQIRFIVPLGSLNPPGHTVPTDHIYFYVADPALGESGASRRTDFFAPADGTVMAVIDNGIGSDRKVYIQATPRMQYNIDHLIPSVALAPGTQVRAGDRLGTSGSSYGIDLGLTNQDVTLPGLLNLARYTPGTEHTDAPLKYFDEPIRSQLYAKVRTIGDRDGRIDHDVAGRLSGNWFDEASQAPLAFAYDTYDPSQVRIAVASGLPLAPMLFGIAAGDPQPREVSVATGLVRYTVTRAGIDGALGQLLVQMLDDRRIRVELVPSPASPVTDFSPAARTFAR